MIKSGSAPLLPSIGTKIKSLIRFQWFFCLMMTVLVTVAAAPPDQQPPDEQYIHIMAIIDRADALRTAGKTEEAKAKYKDAERALLYFKAANPLFDPKTVAYRLKEVTERAETRPALPESAEGSKAKAKLEAESAAAGSKTGVKLLEPGAEPRSVLRLHVKPGDKQTMIMTIKMNMDMQMPGAGAPGAAPAAPMKIPAMTFPMDITVQSVAANGDISYDAVMGEAGVADEPGTLPQVAQAMKTALAGIKGLAVSGVTSSRGVSKKVDIKASASTDPQARQSLEQLKEGMSNMGARLPEEAVGAGAKWEIKRPVKTQGMTVDQTENYELVSAEGDHVKIKFTLTQNATNQKIQSPTMPGAQVNLNQMTASANGTMDADLSRLAASMATVDMHMEMNSDVTAGGKKVPMNMKMDMNMVMEAK